MVEKIDWYEMARHVETYFGSLVDRDEMFFVCPECDEPVYFDDWNGDYELARGCCPICGQKLLDCEEEEE